jgi:hypothetical protein
MCRAQITKKLNIIRLFCGFHRAVDVKTQFASSYARLLLDPMFGGVRRRTCPPMDQKG